MAIDKKKLATRLWTEWTNGIKILNDSLMKDQIEICSSISTCVIGDENVIQRAAIYLHRKIYISKFSDYKTRIGAYEDTFLGLLKEVNELIEEKIEYKSTLRNIIIDGDIDFSNEAWGDHAIDAYEKLGNYVDNVMNILEKAQKELEK